MCFHQLFQQVSSPTLVQLCDLSPSCQNDNLYAATAGPRVTGHLGACPLCWRGAAGTRLPLNPPAASAAVRTGQVHAAAGPAHLHSPPVTFWPGRRRRGRQLTEVPSTPPCLPPPAAPARLPPCPRAAPFPRAACPPRPRYGARGAPAPPDPGGGSCRAERAARGRCEAAGAVRGGGRSPAAGPL